jgi:hypothetical protein
MRLEVNSPNVSTFKLDLVCIVNNFSPSKCQAYKIKLRGFSPQSNYTDRATAACRRS